MLFPDPKVEVGAACPNGETVLLIPKGILEVCCPKVEALVPGATCPKEGTILEEPIVVGCIEPNEKVFEGGCCCVGKFERPPTLEEKLPIEDIGLARFEPNGDCNEL